MEMSELWLRIFAALIVPLLIAYLVVDEVTAAKNTPSPPRQLIWKQQRPLASSNPAADVNNCDDSDDKKEAEEARPAAAGMMTTTIVSLVGKAWAAILATDSLYVHDMGRGPGASSFVLVLAILYLLRTHLCCCYCNRSLPPINDSGSSGVGGGGGRLFWLMLSTTTTASVFVTLLLIKAEVAYALLNSEPTTETATAHHHRLTSTGIDPPTISEGLDYYNGNDCDDPPPSFPSSN